MIGERLGISDKTVRNHVSTVFSKLGVNSRAQAIVRARCRIWAKLKQTVDRVPIRSMARSVALQRARRPEGKVGSRSAGPSVLERTADEPP